MRTFPFWIEGFRLPFLQVSTFERLGRRVESSIKLRTELLALYWA